MKKLKNISIVVVLFILGIFIASSMTKNKPQTQHKESAMPSRNVDVMTVTNIPFRARATGYGNVNPSILLKGMAEVSGKISYIDPLLKQGNSIPANTTVVKINAKDYKVTLKRTQADLAANKSALRQLDAEQKSTKQSHKLAVQNLEVGEKELARIEGVFAKGLVARSAVDAEKQKVLQLKQQVETLQGKLDSYESRKAATLAKISGAQQQVEGQETTLGRTEISLPFDARIGKVNIEKGEFVNVGTVMFEALDIKGVEINAQVAAGQMKPFTEHLAHENIPQLNALNLQNMLGAMGMTAKVRLIGGFEASWDARVVRISESIDNVRRTIGVVVAVDNPYDKIIPGKRPPLLKGMYTAVEIYGPADQAIVIPRKAIHQNRVYLADTENRLKIQPITIKYTQGELAVVESGLNENDKVIINDVVPVIEGMPVTPKVNDEYTNKLKALAVGQ